MKTLANELAIKNAQARFAASFDVLHIAPLTSALGYQSGSATREVSWIPALDIWAHFGLPPGGKSEGGRYWNAFGIGKPGPSVNIVCEINPPFRGINRRVAGAFVQDAAGRVWVGHRGKFTISRGMTMKYFRERYTKPYTSVLDGNSQYNMILIGYLGSSDLPQLLAGFVHEVGRIKGLGRMANP